ncbi:choline dehydrogenase, mitochondrial isoform X2 [Lampetra planeri]
MLNVQARRASSAALHPLLTRLRGDAGRLAGARVATTTPLLSAPLHHSSARQAAAAAGGGAGARYSYVVVGGGSAGCVIAGRLSEDPGASVLLLEAGPRDTVLGSKRLAWKIHMPLALAYNLCDDRYNWCYHTEPQQHMEGRALYWPRGRVLGGSSSLNAMVYIRGHALDYDTWEHDHGARGWSYAHCLPYFRRAQSHALGADPYRGGDGPLHVSRATPGDPLHEAFLEAAAQAGHHITGDMNGYRQEGFGWMDRTIHQGKRWSTACAYLHPALSRPNLEVRHRASATRVLFEGDRAVGVELLRAGVMERVYAEREVILCGGAINSPQLLLLSGIGPEKELKRLGIPVLVNSPGVGLNLQDHLEVYVQRRCLQPVTLYGLLRPHRTISAGLQWLLRFTGPCATAHMDTGGFARSEPSVAHPDVQFHFLPAQVIDHGRVDPTMEAFQAHVGSLRPTSVGWLKLRSTNPTDPPVIQPNYLSTERDVWELRRCVELARDIFSQPALGPFRGAEVSPGPDVTSAVQLDAWVRRHAETAYHPCGTCRMGDTANAVVDEQARVRGAGGLRVVDASVFPCLPSGNTNAPVVMVAERVADMVRGRELLPPSGAPVYSA